MKRPMHIGMLAFVMTFVMVMPVIIITNRGGKVSAVGDAYTANVLLDNIKFTLPELPKGGPSKEQVDLSEPYITLTNSIGGKYSGKYKYTNTDVTVNVEVKASNLKDYSVKRNGKKVDVKLTNENGVYAGSFTVDKENYGTNKIVVEVTDESGNKADSSMSFVIDTKAPLVTTQISKDGNTWYDLSVDEPLDEFLTFYPYVRVKVKDDFEDPDSEYVEMTYTPFDDSDGYTDVVMGKKYRLSAAIGNEEGQYEFVFTVKDLAGNMGINVTGDHTEEEASTDIRMCFSIDKTAPKHNLYITTPHPANFDEFNNTYKNVVHKFGNWKDQENYKYGQYYNGRVTIDLSAYDNSRNYDGEVTIMHRYKAPGAAEAVLCQDDEHIVYAGDSEWSVGSNVHYKYNTIYVDEPGEHEIWLKSNDHEDPNDGIGGYKTTEDSVHLFFTIDDATPAIGLSRPKADDPKADDPKADGSKANLLPVIFLAGAVILLVSAAFIIKKTKKILKVNVKVMN